MSGRDAAFLSESALAARWTVSTRFIRQLRADGKLDHIKLGRRVIYPLSFVEIYEREQLIEARTPTMPRNRRTV